MNIAFRNTLTVPEYLAWAATQDGKVRTELIDGQIIPMSPERVLHVHLKGLLYLALVDARNRADIACHVLTDGATVPIDALTAFVPDALVTLAPLSDTGTTVERPLIVAEVVSPSSLQIDSNLKLAGYFKLASVMHYLLIDPDAMSLTQHRRQRSRRRHSNAGPARPRARPGHALSQAARYLISPMGGLELIKSPISELPQGVLTSRP